MEQQTPDYETMRLFRQKANTSLIHAKQTGDKLLCHKRQFRHGQWQAWFRKHLGDPGLMSYRRAAEYMRIAKRWNEPPLRTARLENKNLSINAAIKLLRYQ